MISLETCIRCGAPLKKDNAQVFDDVLCESCLTYPLPEPETAPAHRRYGLPTIAATTLGLLALLVAVVYRPWRERQPEALPEQVALSVPAMLQAQPAAPVTTPPLPVTAPEVRVVASSQPDEPRRVDLPEVLHQPRQADLPERLHQPRQVPVVVVMGPEMPKPREAFPRRNRSTEADTLERAALLLRYRDSKGIEYTWALTRAIPKLSGSSQEMARLALVNRLAKLPTAELRKRLKQPDVEVRRAAVRAGVKKNDPSLVPDLIALLDDASIAPLARDALKTFTGKDLPNADSWRQWWAGLVRADG